MTLPTPLRRWFALQLLVLLALIATAMPVWADPPTRVARVSEVTGTAEWFDPDQRDWTPLQRNQTLAEGDRLRVGNNSRVGLRVGPHALWLDERSQLELMRLDDQRFDLSLDRGALALRLVTREVARDTQVRTPEGRFTFDRAGAYRVDALGNASRGQVLEGRMAFEHRGQDGAPLWLDAEQSAEVWWADGPRAERNRLRQDDFGQWLASAAGFGREEVARYANRQAYRYVSPELTGAEELDNHGRWETTVEFGPIWYPSRVAVGWAPYRDGNWVWSRHWGWTWRDDLPWGFATSHYGRWVFWGSRWVWSPGAVIVQRPVYAPALVAWVGGGNVQIGVQIGGRYAPPVAWVPLAPYEVYRPWYRHSPDYIRRINPDPDPVTVRRPPVQGWAGNNRGVPGAVSMYANNPGNDQAVARPVPVRDEAVLRSFTPLTQAPSRTELPLAGPARGRMQPDVDSPRQRAGGSQGLPVRPFEGGTTPPVANANPGDAGNLPLRPAPAPWQRGQEESSRGRVPFSTGPTSAPQPQGAAPAATANPDVNVPRRIERQERNERDDAPQRRNPAFERAPEPEMPVRRFETPRPEFRQEQRQEQRQEPRQEQRREEAMPWRQPQQAQPQREEVPQRRFEAPSPPPRMEMPMRRAEPQAAPQAAPQPAPKRPERGDGVPRKRNEVER